MQDEIDHKILVLELRMFIRVTRKTEVCKRSHVASVHADLHNTCCGQ